MKIRVFSIILIIGLVALALWNLFVTLSERRGQPPPEARGLGGSGEEIILGNDRLYYPALVDDGRTIIGLAQQGTIFTRVDTSTGESAALLEDEVLGITEIDYAPDGSGAIVVHKPSAEPAQVSYYDFRNRKTITLNSSIRQVEWTTDSQEIIYLFTTDQKTSIARAKPTTEGFQLLLESAPFPNAELTLSPGGRFVTITRGFLGGEPGQPLDYPLYLFDLKDSRLKELLPKGVFAPKWSPDGSRLAYLRYDATAQVANLNLYTVDSAEEVSTKIATLPNKYTWRNNDELVVASPNPPSPADLFEGIALANQDEIRLVSKSGKEELIASIENAPSVDSLLVSPDGKTLYFRRLDYLRRILLP